MDNNDLLSAEDFLIKPDATAAEIDELLKTANSEVKKAIALHPNTSPETLIKLCEYNPYNRSSRSYYEYVVYNPVISLILLEYPDFLDRLYRRSLHFSHDSAKLPEFVVDWAVNHSGYWIRSQIAANRHISIECLEKLAQDLSSMVRIAVAINICTYNRDFEQSDKTADRTVNYYRDRALKIICQLAEDKNEYIRSVLAGNTGTPISILEQLSFDLDTEVLYAVAGNSQTPASTIRRLFQRDIKTARKLLARAIAGNRGIPIDLMKICASSEDSRLRSNIAGNPSATKEILAKLAKDSDLYVRQQVAINPNTSPETM